MSQGQGITTQIEKLEREMERIKVELLGKFGTTLKNIENKKRAAFVDLLVENGLISKLQLNGNYRIVRKDESEKNRKEQNPEVNLPKNIKKKNDVEVQKKIKKVVHGLKKSDNVEANKKQEEEIPQQKKEEVVPILKKDFEIPKSKLNTFLNHKSCLPLLDSFIIFLVNIGTNWIFNPNTGLLSFSSLSAESASSSSSSSMEPINSKSSSIQKLPSNSKTETQEQNIKSQEETDVQIIGDDNDTLDRNPIIVLDFKHESEDEEHDRDPLMISDDEDTEEPKSKRQKMTEIDDSTTTEQEDFNDREPLNDNEKVDCDDEI